MRKWMGLIWLRIWTMDGLLWWRKWTIYLQNRRVYWPVEHCFILKKLIYCPAYCQFLFL